MGEAKKPAVFRSPRHAAIGGARESLGAPAVVLSASFVGFGSLVRGSGLDLGHALFSTATAWALPGQIATIELTAAGATLLAIAIATALSNARLTPMILALIPQLAAPGRRRWQFYLVAHVVAITSWLHAMRRVPDLPAGQRLPFVAGFGTTLWLLTLAATAIGYVSAAQVPSWLSLGLVFLTPVYFTLVLIGDVKSRVRALSLAFGACLGPLFHLVSTEWGLLLTGLVGGTAAFVLGRPRSRQTGHG